MSHQSVSPVLRAGVATGVAVSGVAFSVLLPVPVFVVSLDSVAQFAVVLVHSELGFVAAGLLFLRATGDGLALLRIPTPDSLAVSVTLVVLFGVSVLLGYPYVWTDNIVVPALVHGCYDALLSGLAYLVLSSDVMVESTIATVSVATATVPVVVAASV